jgi:hypothetical protein
VKDPRGPRYLDRLPLTTLSLDGVLRAFPNVVLGAISRHLSPLPLDLAPLVRQHPPQLLQALQ